MYIPSKFCRIYILALTINIIVIFKFSGVAEVLNIRIPNN